MYTRPTIRQFAEQYPEFTYSALRQRAKRRRLTASPLRIHQRRAHSCRIKPENFFQILDSQGADQ